MSELKILEIYLFYYSTHIILIASLTSSEVYGSALTVKMESHAGRREDPDEVNICIT